MRNPEGRRPLGGSRRRWKNNIKMDVIDVGGGGEYTGSTWLRIGRSGGLL